ncbi:anthranilate phosphoribosyltransferase 2 [Glycocaulis alkaliphilus]|uniref:Anthranilate phosphoribosyltransferase n=1 Tax=Glycocaulis alkaliphilus TaxID=1434191 RepID=A0A3T0EAN5_9PROT|nr:anthranilate phosphoribosyltransferase [Glycocaulis alkaliphilus]AZU04287.1 anthranilate phosphoribosyltransferase 2 [Glycocaulis alkaliphilus]GGB77242.1 anthranilate phosphoribosyltransferase [Glycocaulis alkaliphilus]
MSQMRPAISALAGGKLPAPEALEAAFDALMDGEADLAEIGGFLIGLAAIGEDPGVLATGARAMRARMNTVKAPANAIDTCGTGGDARGTWNISTAAALVAAAAGAVVAKHGNKAASSKSGSAEVLDSSGVNLMATPEQIERALDEAGVAFLFAQAHHGAVRHVAPARKTLGVRTVFNLLGPLSNPAGTRRQLLGVFDQRWLVPMAEALRDLGAERAWIVHGEDGLDEITTTGATHIASLEADGSVREFTVTPEDAGLPRASLDDLKGGEPAENAAALHRLLDGERGAYRDIVLFNASAALVLAGKADGLKDGVALAAAAIDDGRAAGTLNKLVHITNT